MVSDSHHAEESVRDERLPTGINRRRPQGRYRPYRTLRVLAKIYTIFAPLVLGLMVLAGLAGLAREVPLPMKLGSVTGMFVLGVVNYIVMKSIAQAIYLMFDMAGNISRLRQVLAMSQAPAVDPKAPATH